MQKTKDYDMFKNTLFNRPFDHGHCSRLVMSIKSKNMLELRPIIVTEDFEIIDGQHRLEAARILNEPIYYEVRKNADNTDIIQLNVAKSWVLQDYFNFYLKEKYPEYVKLDQFAGKYGIDRSVVVYLMCKRKKENIDAFKEGQFVFKEELIEADMDVVRDCYETLKKNINKNINTKRIWVSLYKIVQDPKFNFDQFRKNVEKLSDRIKIKPTIQETYDHLISIFNYHSSNRIEVSEI